MRIGAILAMGILAAFARPAFATPTFSDWAAVIVSGDDEAAHGDAHTEAFDNARRDIGLALARAGFASANIDELSVEPERHRDQHLGPADLAHIAADFRRLSVRARGGCLFYMTSHGSPEGAALGEQLLSPAALSRTLTAACEARPTVVVISACFSGAFIPALAGPDRMILTAARRDRSSFGCGEGDEYPYFDACVLQALPHATGFPILAREARRCVTRRERQEHLSPPSSPQTWVGAKFHAPRFKSGR